MPNNTDNKTIIHKKDWVIKINLNGINAKSEISNDLLNWKVRDINSIEIVSESKSDCTVIIKTIDGSTHLFENFNTEDALSLNENFNHLSEITVNLRKFLQELRNWYSKIIAIMKQEFKARGYLTDCFISSDFGKIFSEGIPTLNYKDQDLNKIESFFNEVLTGKDLKAWNTWNTSPELVAKDYNSRAVTQIKNNYSLFFNTIEKSPLTQEQINAVTNLNDRVLLSASAGSGKTSVLVARAAYIALFGFEIPQRIVLIAFNTKSVKEISTRIQERFRKIGIFSNGITVKTFHALGLDIIRRITGQHANLADFLDTGDGTIFFNNLIKQIIKKSLAYRLLINYFMYSLPASMNTNSLNGKKEREYSYIVHGFLDFIGIISDIKESHTFDKSIINFVDAKGKIIIYKDPSSNDVEPNKKTLILSTKEVSNGSFIKKIVHFLHRLKIKVIKNTVEDLDSQEYTKSIDNFSGIAKAFLTHAKNKGATPEDLWKKFDKSRSLTIHNLRTAIFLQIYKKIISAWNEQLSGKLDFDDMLNLSSVLLEQHPDFCPYDCIMIDECQDISISRARLIQNLLKAPHTRLFAVGDDWQSINRFSGSVMSVMTHFSQYFGKTDFLKLETTFRCTQDICDISSKFISKNNEQMQKEVHSNNNIKLTPIIVCSLNDTFEISHAVKFLVDEISKKDQDEPKPSILLLGRYNDDEKYVTDICSDPEIGNRVHFLTIHKSKGLEADYVILIRVCSGVMGFPSTISDDPILCMVMPEAEEYPNAEERRLFYVALTRAKKQVYIITLRDAKSEFIKELENDHAVVYKKIDIPAEIRVNRCPECKTGYLRLLHGKNGDFYGCTRYPKCRYTENVDDD